MPDVSGWLTSTYIDLITPGDFDDDGRADLIVRTTSGLWLYRGNGSGGFINPANPSLAAAVGAYRDCFSPGDFGSPAGGREDGYPDLICRDTAGRLWLFLGQAGATLSSPSTFFESGWGAFKRLLAGGDFDGDGHGDVLALTEDAVSNGSLVLYRGLGTGAFVQAAGAVVDSGYSQFNAVVTVW